MTGNDLNSSAFILHIDADSFFTACEVVRNPSLRGQAVATGLERGIVSSLSYEAKARGVKRGMPLFEVKKICPEIVFLPSDYETYSLYSCRLFEIVRRFSPVVEEYSIDECFVDLRGAYKHSEMSYLQIARSISKCLHLELGFSFSLGLAPNKVLAKLASNFKKPNGLTKIEKSEIEFYLKQIKLSKVWGIGPQTTAYLNKCGLKTAEQFAAKDLNWIKNRMNKTKVEIWQELQGEIVYKVSSKRKDEFQSISRTRTFKPPSSKRAYVFSHLSNNAESACLKLRRYKLVTVKIFFFLKTQDLKILGHEIKLTRASDNPIEIIKYIDKYFHLIWNPLNLYRATGVVFMELRENTYRQADLFNEIEQSEKLSRVLSSLDIVSKRYGKSSLFLGSSLLAVQSEESREKKEKDDLRGLTYNNNLFKGDLSAKNLALPFLGEVK